MPPKPAKPKPTVQPQTAEDYAQPLGLQKTPSPSKPLWADIAAAEDMKKAKKKAQKAQQSLSPYSSSLQTLPLAQSSPAQTPQKPDSPLDTATAMALVKTNPALKELEPFKSIWASQTAKRVLPRTIQPVPSQPILSVPTPLQTQKPSFLPKSKYFLKEDAYINIIPIEKEYQNRDPNQIALNLFPSSHHDVPHDAQKTQRFYEFILVDTESISIKHFTNPSNPSEIAYSTAQILKVLTPSEFGSPFNKTSKNFSKPFLPQSFTYWDYQKAWNKAFLFKNSSGQHTWMFYFKKGAQYKFPYWFTQWWHYYGLVPEILPPTVFEGYQTFCKHIILSPEEKLFPMSLLFSSLLSISWILNWRYVFLPNHPPPLQYLGRSFSVKWWDGFEQKFADSSQVLNRITKPQRGLLPPPQAQFQWTSQKAQAQSKLAAASSPEDFERILLEVQAQLKQSRSPSASKSPADLESRAESTDSSESVDYAEPNDETVELTDSQFQLYCTLKKKKKKILARAKD